MDPARAPPQLEATRARLAEGCDQLRVQLPVLAGAAGWARGDNIGDCARGDWAGETEARAGAAGVNRVLRIG